LGGGRDLLHLGLKTPGAREMLRGPGLVADPFEVLRAQTPLWKTSDNTPINSPRQNIDRKKVQPILEQLGCLNSEPHYERFCAFNGGTFFGVGIRRFF